MKPQLKTLCLALATTLTAISQAHAIPSGFKSLPKRELSDLGGLPVELLASETDPKLIYVKPLEGVFKDGGIFKYTDTRCDAVESTFRGERTASTIRETAYRMLADAQKRYDELSEDRRKLNEASIALQAQITTSNARIETLKGRQGAIHQEAVEIVRKIDKIKGDMELETDTTKKASLKAEVSSLETQLGQKKQEKARLQIDIEALEDSVSSFQMSLTGFNSKKKAIDTDLSEVLTMITSTMAALEPLTKATDEVLKKYSNQIGAYVTYISEFAPRRYLDTLKSRFPDFDFRYVPSATASLEPTIAGNLNEGADIEKRTGEMILAANWSDPLDRRKEHPLTKALISGDESIKDPVKLSQTRTAQLASLESSLTGTKFLNLQLSVLGYCAMREQEKIPSLMPTAGADVFRLAMYYTYPVYYSLQVHGRYNSTAMMYDFWKFTKSSSWFGLKKKQRLEHIRKYRSSDFIDVSVKPLGVTLTIDETMALTDKVKDQMTFIAMQPHLDLSGAPTKPNASWDNPTPGAELSAIGKRISMIPNPWAMWGGLVLSSLGGMFGSSNMTVEDTQTSDKWVNINYDMGFTFYESGDLTVGSLKDLPVKEVEKK